jgi:predicted lysophospholipase L1 biosynthesis ABC-type transport system permease subunit
VRLALGASRARLIRPILFEAVMLGAASASLALALTSFAFDALLRQVPAAVYGRAEVGVDLRVATLAFSMGCSARSPSVWFPHGARQAWTCWH